MIVFQYCFRVFILRGFNNPVLFFFHPLVDFFKNFRVVFPPSPLILRVSFLQTFSEKSAASSDLRSLLKYISRQKGIRFGFSKKSMNIFRLRNGTISKAARGSFTPFCCYFSATGGLLLLNPRFLS